MTVIIGYADGKNVWMVGDDVACNGEFSECISGSKVFKLNDNMLIGYTSSFRMGQILQYGIKIPSIKKGEDVDKYMRTYLVDKIIYAFEKANYSKISDNEAKGGTFIIGFLGRIFTVQDDFSVVEYKSPFASVGCGYQYALASMETMEQFKDNFPSHENYIENALKTSLKVSCKFSPYVKLHDEKNIQIFKI